MSYTHPPSPPTPPFPTHYLVRASHCHQTMFIIICDSDSVTTHAEITTLPSIVLPIVLKNVAHSQIARPKLEPTILLPTGINNVWHFCLPLVCILDRGIWYNSGVWLTSHQAIPMCSNSNPPRCGWLRRTPVAQMSFVFVLIVSSARHRGPDWSRLIVVFA